VNIFNLNSFFRDGYSLTYLDQQTSDRLLTLIDRQEFVDEDDPDGLDNPSSLSFDYTWAGLKQPQAPTWDKKNPFNEVPQDLKDFWIDLAKGSYFRWFTDLYGDFTHLSIMVHRYVSGDGMGFHHDVLDSTWLLNLIYLVDEPFYEADGGYLGVGHCVVNSECVPIRGTEQEILRVVPSHGLMVTLNNRNPSVLHRVEKLISNKTRRVLVCQMGYIENVIHKEGLGR